MRGQVTCPIKSSQLIFGASSQCQELVTTTMMKKSIFLLFLAFALCSSQRCESGWKAIYGRCYRYFDINETWKRAEEYCNVHYNGHLASVPNINSLVNLVNDARKYPTTFWVGGRWNGYSWSWTDNTRFSVGGVRQPMGRSNFNCVEIDSRTAYSTWSGADCSRQQPFVCVK